jgi:hypothetical protein
MEIPIDVLYNPQGEGTGLLKSFSDASMSRWMVAISSRFKSGS